MSRIKNMPRVGWFAAGVIITLLLVPTVAVAATGGTIIKGSPSGNKVDVSGAGQLLTNEANPGSYVFVEGGNNCSAGGFYMIPSNEALIITGVDFFFHAPAPGNSEADLFYGPSANPCLNFAAAGVTDGTELPNTAQNQVFEPGIAVPAGDVLGGKTLNTGSFFAVYGYLVPAGAVAGPALSAPRMPAGATATLTP
jgi:hypothetical protein